MQNQEHNSKDHLRGLSKQEAGERFLRYGPNELGRNTRSVIFDFLGRFKNPLVLILLGAAVIAGFFGDAISSVLIIIIVLVSGTMDFVNAYRAQKSAEALQNKVRVTTAVVREGLIQEIPISQVVPGDVIKLLPGDIIPADGRIIAADDFFVNESSLTGESFPVERKRDDRIFMGSSAVTGNAFMEAEVTGRGTKFGAIAEKLSGADEPTEFDRGIREFSYLIMRIMFVLVIIVFFINSFTHHSALDSLLFAAALAVGITPELLPMIITLNLKKGSVAMSRHGVIVKKLSAIQNCGSMDILCTDKTGTLTEDRITLVKYVDAAGKESEDVLRYAYLNGIYGTALKNPLDAAIADFRKIEISGFHKTEEIPFDFTRRRDSIAVENRGEHTLITKGAPEGIFEICAHYQDERHNFGEEIRGEAQREYERLSAEGFRVLGVATKRVIHPKTSYSKADEHNMAFQGFVAFFDPPKKTVAHTLKLIEARGVEVKILTGDSEIVTQKVAQEIDLPVKGVITGAEIEKISDDELTAIVGANTIFARIAPEQKTKIIKTLQAMGHGVGYLGDGINDAPSLKLADVGISVNNAVDVAKESADFILLNKDLHSLINGISEGRRTFANTLKYLKMSLSSDFGNMFSMAGASVLLPFFPMLALQILFNDLLYDASQFAIPMDNVDPEELEKPRKFNIGFIKKFMLVFGPLSSLFDFLAFVVLFFIFHLSASGFQTGWFLESIATQTFVVYIIRTQRSFFKSKPAWPLVGATCGAVVVAYGVALSALGGIFKFSPLPWPALFAIAGIVVLYLLVVEAVKSKFFKSSSF